MSKPPKVDEPTYRSLVQAALDRIETAFEGIDPDTAECNQALGALTITLGDGTRCILSGQPSVRQLWLAVASRGVAFHFDYDEAARQWLDDKGKGIELLSYLSTYLSESTGQKIKIG